MKEDSNWKPQSTSSLINILENMIKLQFLDLHRALYNKRNYILHGIFRRHCIREDLFRTKTVNDQKKYFHRFLKSTTHKPTFITPKDGQYKIPSKEKEVTKKLCQSKRPVNAKTSKEYWQFHRDHLKNKLFVNCNIFSLVYLLYCYTCLYSVEDCYSSECKK